MNGKTLGHYRVGEQLGRGGMGEVFIADDLSFDRKVALKFLPDAFTGDPERMARFEREAKVLASLNHPNIAAIYGLELAEGKRFIVMELVEGETLDQRLSKGRLPVDESLGICRQIAEGLEAAHEKGERDINRRGTGFSVGRPQRKRTISKCDSAFLYISAPLSRRETNSSGNKSVKFLVHNIVDPNLIISSLPFRAEISPRSGQRTGNG